MTAGALRSIILLHTEQKMTSLQGTTVCPSQLLHTLSSLAHLSFSYSFTPKALGSHHHRTPDAPAAPGRLRSTALSLLPQPDEQELYPPLAENAWKHASLLGKLNCWQINAKYTWVKSWCLWVVQLYPTCTTRTSGNWYSHAEKHGIPQPDFTWSKLEQNISLWRKIPFCRQATF